MDRDKYTSVDVAKENNLLTFHKLTQDITDGTHQPGDGLKSKWLDLARDVSDI